MKRIIKTVVIIGGGTAGLTIAKNLQDYFNVIVIEKSKYKRYPLWYRPPLFIGMLLRKVKSKYIHKRDFELSSGRCIPFFESNVFGGTSVINGCVHTLGNKLQWIKILKPFNFNYDDLIDSYNKIYSFNPKVKNKINLSSACQNIIDKSFFKSLSLFKIKSRDTNYSNEESFGPIINTTRKYFRTSVLSLLKKKKFQVFLGEKVLNLIFGNDGKVSGVRTNARSVNADYVIVSCGVIGTCDFLLREKLLNNDLNDLVIGEGVQDHTNLRINILTNKKINSLNEIYNSFFGRFLLIFKYFIGQSTLMKGTGATAAVHLDLDQDGKVDTRIQIVQFSETGRHGSNGKIFSSSQPGFSISITAINPQSKGKITLNGNSNYVDPMYLSSKNDIELLKKALVFSLKLLRSSYMFNHILKIEDEHIIINNPEKYILDNFHSGYHLIGGLNSAIDSNFEIHGIKGLYVCDASIFDRYAASNIHSSVILIADLFSKRFLANNLS